MLKIELAENHSSVPDLIQKVHTLINDVMKEKWRRFLQVKSMNYNCSNHLRNSKNIFTSLRLLKPWKFSAILNQSLKNISCRLPKSCLCGRKLFFCPEVSKTNLYTIIWLPDIYKVLSYFSTVVQSSYQLTLENMCIQIEITIQNVNDSSCGNSRDILLQIINKLPEGLFKHT